MVRIRPHLDALVPEIQREVGAALSGLLTGAVVRSNLPQVWVFETEEETVTLMVDGEGNVSTLEGAPEHPDVGIRAPSEDLAFVLRERRLPEGAGERVLRRLYTRKGRLAWEFLRGRFGL
jgi:hypothetical protein